MRVTIDPLHFPEQCRRYALRFCCEDCAHFDERRDGCAHGWPTEVHRRAYYAQANASELIFCKEFELR